MLDREFARLNIAVVDDNRNFLRVMGAILRSFNVGEVHESTDPAGILDDVLAGRFDLLLTDNVMPDLDGFEMIRQIRSNDDVPLPNLPIILVSAYADREIIENAVRVGADGFLAKPVRPAEMFRSLVTQIRNPLPRVSSPRYFGPCRRRGLPPVKFGENRRSGIIAA